MSDDPANWTWHPINETDSVRTIEPGLLDANYNGDIVETLRQIDLMLRNRMGAIEPLLAQVLAQLADIQAKLTRIEPFIEYGEQLVQQRAKLAKWIPGKARPDREWPPGPDATVAPPGKKT